MKRFLFLLSAVVVSMTMAAQMQVWRNGTIIFSHDQTDVDSISFGSPMQVQANYNALSSTSLAGSVYVSSLSGSGEYSDKHLNRVNGLEALFFLNDSIVYYGINKYGSAKRNDYNNETHNSLYAYIYEISGDNITLSYGSKTIHGKVIGKNGLVFADFVVGNYGGSSPAVFITLNR